MNQKPAAVKAPMTSAANTNAMTTLGVFGLEWTGPDGPYDGVPWTTGGGGATGGGGSLRTNSDPQCWHW